MNNPKWAIIGRGQNGWHAEAKNVSSSSSSNSPEALQKYVDEAEEGCLVYDALEADVDIFSAFVIAGPMCNPGTDHSNVFTDDDRKDTEHMLLGLQGAFRAAALLEIQQAKRPDKRFSGFGSFDYVSTEVYCELLKKHVPNVKFGYVENGKVVWDC